MGFHSHSAMVKAGSTVSKVVKVRKVNWAIWRAPNSIKSFPTMHQAPDILSGAQQMARQEKSNSRDILKVGSETETGGEKKMAAGGSKKEEKIRLLLKEEKIRLPLKGKDVRMPAKEEIFYRSWEEGNEADPWVVVDLKIVKK